MTCIRYDAATGKQRYTERIGGASRYTAALVTADSRLYCVRETDGVRVVKIDPEVKLSAIDQASKRSTAAGGTGGSDRNGSDHEGGRVCSAVVGEA